MKTPEENSAKEPIIACEVCELKDAIHYSGGKYYCCGCFSKHINELQEALKEIIPIAEQFSDNYPVSATVLRVKQVIEKAKKLIK